HFDVVVRSVSGNLINLFWEVAATGAPGLRGANVSGLNIRGLATGTAAVSVAATDVAIAPLADAGFVTAVNQSSNVLRLHSWENLRVSCSGDGQIVCQFAPSNLANDALDSNAGPGVTLPQPTLTTVRSMLRDPLYADDLYAQNADVVQSIASVRKVMVAMIALEREDAGEISMNDDVVVSADAAAVVGSGASNMGMVQGETISMENLMFGNMMVSAGDATWAISEHAAGTVEDMVTLMNDKANALGLANTTYCTDGSGQGFSSVGYSTVRDQALLWESVWDDAEFLSYAGASSEEVCGTVNGADFCHPAIPPMTKNMAVDPGTQGHKTGGGATTCSDPQFAGLQTCPSG
ncbi:MAG: D-alanyl-D-alanine carboxypeptidase family protein, partial [Caldilineaceae bacterium]